MFFQIMERIMSPGVDVMISIRKCEGKLMVSTVTKAQNLIDEAQKRIVPGTATGTAAELDQQFFQIIATPIQQATGVLQNMKSFEQSVQVAEQNSKKQKDNKQKAATETKEKKQKYDEHIKQADSLEKESKWTEAIDELEKAKEYTDKPEKIDQRIQELQSKNNQKSLFDTVPEPPTAQPTPLQNPISSAENIAVQQIVPIQAVVPEPVSLKNVSYDAEPNTQIYESAMNQQTPPAQAVNYQQTPSSQIPQAAQPIPVQMPQPTQPVTAQPIQQMPTHLDYVPMGLPPGMENFPTHRPGEYAGYPDFPANNDFYQ